MSKEGGGGAVGPTGRRGPQSEAVEIKSPERYRLL